MGVRYDPGDLKAIGKQCSSRLPPASIMQAMFMYEMQRQSDVEGLFQGQLFQLARAEDEVQLHDKRLSEVEEQMKEVSKRALSKDIEERLATSKVRTDVLAARLNEHFVRLGDHSRRLTDVETNSPGLKAAKQKENDQSGTLTNDIVTIKAALESGEKEAKSKLADTNKQVKFLQNELHSARVETKNSLESADEDIQTLFDERDAMITLLEQSKERIDGLEALLTASDEKIETLHALLNSSNERVDGLEIQLTQSNDRMITLEDNLRALTMQRSSTNSSD